jgi:hypothetical protein
MNVGHQKIQGPKLFIIDVSHNFRNSSHQYEGFNVIVRASIYHGLICGKTIDDQMLD